MAEVVSVWDQAEAILKSLVQPSMPDDAPAAAAADAETGSGSTGAKPRAPEFRPSPSCLLSEDLVNRLLAQLLNNPQAGLVLLLGLVSLMLVSCCWY